MSVLPISKLVNPIKQHLKKPFSLLLSSGVVVTGITLKTEPALAYCIYNYSTEHTIFASEQSHRGGTRFHETIEPAEKVGLPRKECCPWNEDTCVRGSGNDKYGTTTLLVSVTEPEEAAERAKAKGGKMKIYNGGVLNYRDGEFVACWSGPCQGHDINRDGSKGAPDGSTLD